VTHGSYNYFFTRPHIATQHPQGAAQYLFHAQPDAGFSAITATASTVLMLPSPGLILTLVGMYGLMFLTYKTADKPVGILSAFAFTGFLGYILGPMLNAYLSAGMGDLSAWRWAVPRWCSSAARPTC
jgi:hypothetical protein